MRIIDANTDYYDYLQSIYQDNSLVFDRRDSFLLTKKFLCECLKVNSWRSTDYSSTNYLLLQICNSFWLFGVDIIKLNGYRPSDYNMKLLRSWKNYDKARKLISLDVIYFRFIPGYYELKDPEKRLDSQIQAIDTNNYRIWKSINRFFIYPGNDLNRKIEKHIPLLKACGIAEWINPLDIYLAFEEYFSLEKSSSERREPIGNTDIDKIESHGFDVKTSFRGQKKQE